MTFPSTRKQGGGQTKRWCPDVDMIEEAAVDPTPPVPQSASASVRIHVEENTSCPNYVHISHLMESANCTSVHLKKFIGIRLLDHRSHQEMHAKMMDISQRTLLSKQMDKGWKELKELAGMQSRRYTPSRISSPKVPMVTVSPVPISMTPRTSKPPETNKWEIENEPMNAKPKKARPSIRCAKCKKTNIGPNAPKFHIVPTYPAPHPKENPTMTQVAKRQGRILLHEEMMECVTGSCQACTVKTYFCEDHDFETITKYKSFKYNGEIHRQRYILTGMMKGTSMESSVIDYKTMSKGIPHNRSLRKKIEDVSLKILPPTVYKEMDAIHTSLLHELQSKGDSDKEKSLSQIK